MILDIQARSMKANVCEVWGFDSLYGQGTFHRDVVQDWLDASSLRPKTKFFFSSTSETSGNAVDLDQREEAGIEHVLDRGVQRKSASLPNKFAKASQWNKFTMAVSSSWHYETITKNFLNRVKNASCLS